MTITPPVRQALIEGRDQVWTRHHNDPNFTGCGIGFRRRGGVVTDEPAVIAMVVDKLPAGALSSRRLLPDSVRVNGADYGVDVVEAGPVYASGTQTGAAPLSVTNSGLTGPYRPLAMGCGISNSDITVSNPNGPKASPSPTGTLGCFVEDAQGTVYLVSAGHVLAGGFNDIWTLGNPSNPSHIVQPGLADQGSTGSTYSSPVAQVDFVNTVDTTPGALDNNLDYGTAVLAGTGVSPTFANNLMAPISATHPAVGMVIASDWGGNSFLTRMDSTLNAIGLPLLGSNAVGAWTVAPQVGTNIEKVGRSSAYTSSTIDATDVIATVGYVNPDTNTVVPVTMSGIIWSQYYSIGGDSGAVACQGGNGHTYVLPLRAPCPLLQNVQSYYNLPSNLSDNTLTNNLQAKVLTQTLTGNLLIGLVYMNQQTAIDRLNASTGSAFNQPTAQAYFQQFYAKYRPVIVSLLTNPGSFTLTMAMATDFVYAVKMLGATPANGGQGILTSQEYSLGAEAGFYLGVLASNNCNYQQIQAFLDNPSVYDQFYEYMVNVPTIELP